MSNFERTNAPDAAIPPPSAAKKGRLVGLFTLCGVLAVAAMTPYQLQAGMLQSVSNASGVPVAALIAATAAQTAVFCLIASWIGLTLASRVGLGAPSLTAWLYRGGRTKLSGGWLAAAAIGSLIGTAIVVLLEVAVFQPRLGGIAAAPRVDAWKAALLMFYGGIVEEVLIRLGLMTFVVWLLSIPHRRRQRPIPPAVYGTAIVLAAVLFGLGHLPATLQLFGELNGLLVMRAIALNGLLGVFFGYLYWRKGLEYAIFAHMIADVLLHVVLPALTA
ncbi:CPBP family intramembrane glutamic endopeptidase [Paenibacillus sp. GYB003]|uniref:CPBP family intramembrane glutamic endopeptidase n=1 Tax=Paenibacillus sp. GYB003 TaxID=2994392 RepID=UPI002F96BBE8